MLGIILLNFSWFLLFIQFIRGAIELFNLNKTLRWLNKYDGYRYSGKIKEADLPFFYILLPVLREQKVLAETINNFLSINYPKNRFKIAIITTQKEIEEKEKNKNKLKNLTNDLSKNISYSLLLEKYLGLFDALKLKTIFFKYRNKKSELTYPFLLDEYEKYPTTIALGKKLLEIINKNLANDIVELIHYPKIFGVMAHQVNYAAEKISFRHKDSENIYIALYNADSKFHPNTLMFVAENIKKIAHEGIFQQSAIFTKNFNSVGIGIKSIILKAGGLFQTLWTLSHEIPRLKSQSNSTLKIKSKNRIRNFFSARLAHCVGHGMIIKLSFFKNLGYFPLETFNEDLPFGFYAGVRNIPIIPLPILEYADTPETVKHLINQKKVWFWSYLDYLKCRKVALDNHLGGSYLINSLTAQGLLNGFLWLIGSVLFLFPIILGLVYLNLYLLLVSFYGLLLFHYFPFFIVLFNLRKLHQVADAPKVNIKIADFLLIPILGLFILFTDSLGPWLAVIEKIKLSFTGNIPYKQKTER